MGEGLDLLRGHVQRFNAGVRGGDFSPMVEWFTEDGEMVVDGAGLGPLRGRLAIRAAYRNRPPDDVIEILDAFEPDKDLVVATYAWGRAPTSPAGELHLVREGNQIARLVITLTSAAQRDR